MQEARLEGLGGHKILAKACNLAGVGIASVGGCFRLGESLG